MERRTGIVAVAAFVVLAGTASGQSLNPGPPGPLVVDIRGATSGVPHGVDFSPELAAGTIVPTRGLGASIGGHVYPAGIGPARLGIGVDVTAVRGSTVDASSTLATVAPQLSFNFGTSDGWSYLSAGLGVAWFRLDPGLSSSVRSVNYGGGARWFVGPRLGIGFDVRVHRLRAGESTPPATAVSLAVGVSMNPG